MPAVRRRVGVVFQDFRLLDHLSAFDNVALPLRIAGVPEPQVKSHTEELLSWVGLADRLGATPTTLSGGEKQRVAIARAVIAKPELLAQKSILEVIKDGFGHRGALPNIPQRTFKSTVTDALERNHAK